MFGAGNLALLGCFRARNGTGHNLLPYQAYKGETDETQTDVDFSGLAGTGWNRLLSPARRARQAQLQRIGRATAAGRDEAFSTALPGGRVA